MQKNEIRLNYQQANQLVQVGRFDEALEILKEINQIKPNTENVLYLMAVCQAKAGRKEDALELCERLIQDFDHDNAKILIKTISTQVSPLGREKKKREPERKKTQHSEDVVPSTDQEKTSSALEQSDSETENIAAGIPGEDSAEQTVEKIPAITEEGDTTAANESAPEKSTNDAKPDATEDEQNGDSAISKSGMRRPMWLVLLWSSMLALLAAYLLYVYLIDPWINPF